jgi:MFS superfamily sulfate permease-like transporter
VRANQEILALGAANAAAGLTQSFAVGASGSRTAVSDRRPHPAGRDDLGSRRRRRVGVPDRTGGLVVAVALSILHATSRSARPHDAVLGWVQRLGRYADASTHPSAQITPAVVVYRLDDRLFFANAAYVRARILEALNGATTRTRWLVFDAEGVSTVDSTGTEMLEQLIDQLATMGIELAVARAKGPLLEALETAGLIDRIGAMNLYPNIEAAVVACAQKTEPA